MDARSLRPEPHVAQQSRRDKLRIQQSSLTTIQQLDDFPNNLEQLSVHPGLNPDLVQVRNVRNGSMIYDPTVFSSEMLNFATSSNVLSAQRDAMIGQELGAVQTSRPVPAEDSAFTNMSHPVLSNSSASPKPTGDPQGCGNWRSLDAQQCYDWMVNYPSGSVGGERNQKPLFVGEGLSNNARASNISTSTHYMKPSYSGYQDVQLQSTLANPSSEISGQDSQKQFREMQFGSHPLYHSTLQDVITSASFGATERILLPSFTNQSTGLHFDNANAWISRPVENCHQWSNELGHIARKSDQELRTIASDANTQGLSLSLSSNPPSKVNVTQFGEEYESESLQPKSGGFKEPLQDSKLVKASYTCLMPKPSIISKGSGKSLQDIVGSTHVLRNTGPLGPFTGYATILKSSRFLKPAQELLDEFCSVTGSKVMRTCQSSERISGEVSASASVDAEAGANGNHNSGVSSSTFYSSNEGSGDGRPGSSSYESNRPEYQQKKAKLLYLQEEVGLHLTACPSALSFYFSC